MNLKHLPTPALIVDERIFNQNAAQMKTLLKDSTLKLRPHYKSHKCAAIARMQMQNGAVGMTCAKLDEALDLADSGVENILIANQIVDKQKIARLAHLANACRLTVCVDDMGNVDDLEQAAALASSTVYCLVEYDIGMARCGVFHKEEVAALAEHIAGCPHLRFEGIQAYAGHVSHTVSLDERKVMTAGNYARVKELVSYLEEKGIAVNTVSGGSTGTSVIKAREGLFTELQAGSYLFMDATYAELGLPFQNSLFILTTVVSVSGDITVVDAGVKSCGVDQGMPVPLGFSVSRIVASEEHFQLHNPSKKFAVGDKILLVPAHCCSTVNLHDKIYLVNGDKVVDRFAVSARGGFR